MCFSALLCAHSFAVGDWNSHTIDDILKKGNRLYLDALIRGLIPDTDTLSLDYLPTIICPFFYLNYQC